jgi:hypothetical protein
VHFVEMGFRFPEESGQASSDLALASAVVRRARFLWPVTIFFLCFLCFAQDFGFESKKFAYVSAIEKPGRVDFGHVDLGTLRLGLLIWISLSFLVLLEGISG